MALKGYHRGWPWVEWGPEPLIHVKTAPGINTLIKTGIATGPFSYSKIHKGFRIFRITAEQNTQRGGAVHAN
jgi:hypothetical protein